MSKFDKDNTVISGRLGICTGTSTLNYALWVHAASGYGSDGRNMTISGPPPVPPYACCYLAYNGTASWLTSATNPPSVPSSFIDSGGLAIANEGNLSCNAIFGACVPVITSDVRIKKNIVPISDEEGIDIVRQLQPCRYEYIDNINHQGFHLGYIAQDVQKVLPEAIKYLRRAIPDVFEIAKVSSDGNTLTLNEKTTDIFLNDTGKIIQLEIYDNDSDRSVFEVDVLKIIDDKTFVVSKSFNNGMVFVFGKIVDDFRNITYDNINTMTVSAIKSLDDIICKSNETIDTMIDDLNKISNILNIPAISIS